MIDLGRLEERLNSDRQFRQQFLGNPVGTLLKEGLVLSAEQQRRLREAVGKLTTAPTKKLSLMFPTETI
jgi:hypothetical protein